MTKMTATTSRLTSIILAALPVLVAIAPAPACAQQAGANASAADGVASRMQEAKASGVSIRIKEGARITAAKLAARHKVRYDKIEPGMFGAIKLVRNELVSLEEAQADAERLRSDPAVESASADYVMQSSYNTR